MDRIRTLLLARTATVVLDPDRVARAATRPARDADFERFEDDLLQLGYILSLDLALTVRRLPHQAIQELKAWIFETLAASTAHRPIVPSAAAGKSPYQGHVLSWLATRAAQPCPWCGQVKVVGALDPCGHLVCKSCWDDGAFAGCPVCNRRIAPTAPFAADAAGGERVRRHPGELRLVCLAFDVLGMARARFEKLVAWTAPLGPADREEIESVIDVVGPKAADWLPARIPARETMAIAIARLWLVAPDRMAMMTTTQPHVRSASDVLRIVAVLMGADPALVDARKTGRMTLRSIPRGLRRAALEALARIPPDALLEDMRRHANLWKRVGERLHPFERAAQLPDVALAFAAIRGTDLATITFGDRTSAPLRGAARPGGAGACDRLRAGSLPRVRIVGDRVRVSAWGAPVEDALRTGDVRAAVEWLAERPGELLRRVDHLVRVAAPDAIADVLAAIERALARGAPARVLVLGAHIAARGAAWPHRVFTPHGGRRAWLAPDRRPALAAPVRDAIVELVHRELLARAEARRPFARAVIDRALDELMVPVPERRVAMFAELVRAVRPSLWDVACVHAAARANVIYVRERDGRVAIFQRRDHETTLARLARLRASDHDGERTKIPPANAPTWLAIVRDDLEIPPGSTGFVLEAHGTGIARLSRSVLVADLPVVIR